MTPENFLAVLRGDAEAVRGKGSGKVLKRYRLFRGLHTLRAAAVHRGPEGAQFFAPVTFEKLEDSFVLTQATQSDVWLVRFCAHTPVIQGLSCFSSPYDFMHIPLSSKPSLPVPSSFPMTACLPSTPSHYLFLDTGCHLICPGCS